MAPLPPGRPRRPSTGHHPRPHLPGKSPLTTPESGVRLSLTSTDAQDLHANLENLLEEGKGTPAFEKLYRLLGWRLVATSGGTGLTARISELARNAQTLEQYEAARDEELGPILDGLERGENRDP